MVTVQIASHMSYGQLTEQKYVSGPHVFSWSLSHSSCSPRQVDDYSNPRKDKVDETRMVVLRLSLPHILRFHGIFYLWLGVAINTSCLQIEVPLESSGLSPCSGHFWYPVSRHVQISEFQSTSQCSWRSTQHMVNLSYLSNNLIFSR